MEEKGWTTTINLIESLMPQHIHTLQATDEEVVDRRIPENRFLAEGEHVYRPASNLGSIAGGTLTANGGSLPYNNLQPNLVVNFIITLVGIYPSITEAI